jgi:RNA polymerase sigma factor (TIGR02999 family)
MLPRSPEDATAILNSALRGDEHAARRLWEWLYTELRRLAHRQFNGNPRGQPATAIVHEAYLRLFRNSAAVEWSNRRQFFAAAAQVMRQIRIDDARRRNRAKRGGGRAHASIDDNEPAIFDQDPAEVLGVHESLARLESVDPRKADVVRLRYFAALSEQETAAAMEISRRTVQSEWRLARAWLHRDLSRGDTDVVL